MEVLHNQGREGFTLRAIRRGYPHHGGSLYYDFEELVISVPKVLISLKIDAHMPTSPQLIDRMIREMAPSDRQSMLLTPKRLVDLVSHVDLFTLDLGSEMLSLRGVYHQNRLHSIKDPIRQHTKFRRYVRGYDQQDIADMQKDENDLIEKMEKVGVPGT